jgi:hypothetical protein
MPASRKTAVTKGDEKSPTLEDFLARGYLPKELPFLFNTGRFASIAREAYEKLEPKALVKLRTKPLAIPIGSKGGNRRTASIPNPISQTRLVETIVDGWCEILSFCKRSEISFSRLEFPGKERILKNERRGDPLHSYEGIRLTKLFSQKRLELSASSNYILKADIASFYGSIYTHSLPWALHGKDKAKRSFNDMSLLGNRLDEAVRHGNDGQTKGIPIGPDTSRILSEIIGTAVDNRLKTRLKRRVSQGYEGIRWVDDFMLYFQSPGGRDKALGTLVEALEDYELSLNHQKTQFLLPGEDMIESPWAHLLRRYRFQSRPLPQLYDLLGFADQVCSLAKNYPGESVALYGSRVLWSLPVGEENLADLLSVFWKLTHLDSRIVSVVAIYTAELSPARFNSYRIRKITREALDFHLADFIERRWALETSWLLWLSLRTGLSLNRGLSDKLSKFDHPLVALAAMELERNSLTTVGLDGSEWKESVADDDAVVGPRWMLAYELRKQGSLRKPMRNSFFDYLKSKNISFLKDQARS